MHYAFTSIIGNRAIYEWDVGDEQIHFIVRSAFDYCNYNNKMLLSSNIALHRQKQFLCVQNSFTPQSSSDRPKRHLPPNQTQL